MAKGHLLVDVLHRLVRRPQEILVLWNWKSVLLSIILRAPIFLTDATAVSSAGIPDALATLNSAFAGSRDRLGGDQRGIGVVQLVCDAARSAAGGR